MRTIDELKEAMVEEINRTYFRNLKIAFIVAGILAVVATWIVYDPLYWNDLEWLVSPMAVLLTALFGVPMRISLTKARDRKINILTLYFEAMR